MAILSVDPQENQTAIDAVGVLLCRSIKSMLAYFIHMWYRQLLSIGQESPLEDHQHRSEDHQLLADFFGGHIQLSVPQCNSQHAKGSILPWTPSVWPTACW